MSEHVTTWLGAYHDGELGGRRLRQVEEHLADCATCRAVLERLRALGALLQESPPAEDLMPPERFVAQVGLRLPRRPARPAWQRALHTGWRLMPAGLLGAWAFVQAVFVVAGLVLTALRLGLGGEVAASLLPTPQGTPWLAQVFALSGAGLNDVVQVMARLLKAGGPLGWGVTLNLGSLIAIGLLYWSWLASWWAHRQRRTPVPDH
jgi:anti-sigma factor RsiW